MLGATGARVVVEEYLRGEEASFIVVADGETYVPFVSSQDHNPSTTVTKDPTQAGWVPMLRRRS